ncbi:hypothetical protein [Roseovarius sp. Pro17]|uniref:hypothetical protein n=1 Tax=Roseovarius sp. Pro17 TaxID=3108175 RepID=UPI002D79BA3D|nr:hypothetical protein [Roseovarius sp. Pro17]
MMICDADFQDLLPDLFPPDTDGTTLKDASKTCLAQGDDDGGRAHDAIPASQAAIARTGYRMPDQMRAGPALAMMPAYSMAWAMMSAFDNTPRA